MNKIISNEQPTIRNVPYKLAIIGEAPGEYEVLADSPFVGPSGKLLWAACQEANIMRSACLVGNVCQFRPPNNNINRFPWGGFEIQDGLAKLKDDINEFDPNCVLLLGATSCRAAGLDIDKHLSISKLRGSIFMCTDLDSPFYNRKCVVANHPANILYDSRQLPLFRFDVSRAAKQALTPDWTNPEETCKLRYGLDFPNAYGRLLQIRSGQTISLDLEGGCDVLTCFGVATSPTEAIAIDPRAYPLHQRVKLWREIARICADPKIYKILQNATYDTFVLAYGHNIPLLGVIWDTMFSGWEIYPELPKGLDTQCSIWTEWPYYKFERKIGDGITLQKYNCKDTLATYSLYEQHKGVLGSENRAASLEHFNLNMRLLPCVNYMMLKGIRYDTEKKDSRLAEIQVKKAELQSIINELAGHELNPASPKAMCQTLYREKGFPTQYQKVGNRNTNKPTADSDALLKLLMDFNDDLIYNVLMWRHLEGIRKQLVDCDPDGRMRASYTIPGTKTGRLSCQTSNTSNGLNLQTITKLNRDLFCADDGYWFAQLDLEGADSWTVAYHCLAQGDPNMIKDLKAGVKPAQVVVALWQYGEEILNMSSEDLKPVIDELKKSPNWGWQYFAAKCIHHGTNYGAGPLQVSRIILKQSWKIHQNPIKLKSTTCKNLQHLYLRRYQGIQRWHKFVIDQVRMTKMIQTAAGPHVVFTNVNDKSQHGELFSHEPQTNTTYATTLAMLRLWEDPANRLDDRLIIQPLHQVHDAMCVQFLRSDLEFALSRLPTYFQNEITIASEQVTIPFEGEYGPNWAELKHPI